MAQRAERDELVFLPLGGVGEIGINLGLYGYGPPQARTWLAVDFGVAFAGPDLPGVDLIFPDISYLEEERTNLAGIVLTHAHEDHFGALLDLWPRLRVPVYATPFAAGLIAAKRVGEPDAPEIPITIVSPGRRFTVGPFDLEYIPVAHSIPKSYAIALRTPLGTVVHTGDWKLDDTPTLGPPTDRARLEEIGREGVLALVCNSTNAMREGRSPSESDVARELEKVVAEAKARVAFTTFASNVGRTRSIALAAAKAGRNVVIVGRALRRALEVSGELGLLEGLPPFLDEDAYGHLPRDKVVAILTGSQGEPRAALARAAEDDHPVVELSPGDLVVFSSRPIPGNEIAINRIANSLIARGIHVITDRDRLVHASGHPRRDELAAMYAWVKPQILVPVHGEAMHLAAQADFGRQSGIKTVIEIRNGTMVRLAPPPATKVDDVAAGRLYKDGKIIGDIEAIGVPERRRLAFAGQVSVSVVLGRNGEVEREPDIALNGLPRRDGFGRPLEETVMAAVLGTLDSIPKARRRDAEMVREAIRRSVRAAVGEAWGKKPNCTVFVAVL